MQALRYLGAQPQPFRRRAFRKAAAVACGNPGRGDGLRLRLLRTGLVTVIGTDPRGNGRYRVCGRVV